MSKLTGKTIYSVKRRSVTRKSGFKVKSEFKGIRLKFGKAQSVKLNKSQKLNITFDYSNLSDKGWYGFGLYYKSQRPIDLEIINKNGKNYIRNYDYSIWSKCGSIWYSKKSSKNIFINFKNKYYSKDNQIYFYKINGGLITHEFLDINHKLWKTCDYKKHTSNLSTYMPEANFVLKKANININQIIKKSEITIPLKSCNRCMRYLPVNLGKHDNKNLSFSNHCAQCNHSNFGKIQMYNESKFEKLRHGFQLECRYCKKFVVNLPLNPMRTAGQMKEDGQRRRSFELLLQEIYGGSPQILFKTKCKEELPDFIWNKFDKKCFNCKNPISSSKKMFLDHTRPLAMLWPLDETATCLCNSCNAEKSSKFPSEFYNEDKIVKLSEITGIDIMDLKNPTPNIKAVDFIVKNKEWLFKVFLRKKRLQKTKEGKKASDLIIKALNKTFNSIPAGAPFDIVSEYKKYKS